LYVRYPTYSIGQAAGGGKCHRLLIADRGRLFILTKATGRGINQLVG